MLDSRWSARMPPSWPVPSANINIVLLILAPQSIRFAWLAFAATRVSRLAAKLVHFASIVAGASAQEHEHHRDRSVICGATVSWLIDETAPLSDRVSPPRRPKDAGTVGAAAIPYSRCIGCMPQRPRPRESRVGKEGVRT